MAAKKKAEEKKTARPVAKPKEAKAPVAEPVKKAAKKTAGFHIMDNPQAFADGVGASLRTVLERRKGRESDMRPQSEMLIDTLPLRSLYFQWMINNRGLPKGVTNLVGKDKLGKTSLLWNLFGGFVLAGHPCMLMVCENKPASPIWAARCMTSDRESAHTMVSSVMTDRFRLLEEMAETLLEWCRVLRDPKAPNFVPMAITIVAAGDPINKLATNAQAAGTSEFDGKEKEKMVDIADHGHMWDRAKWLHDWITRFLLQLSRYNVHLFLSEHQNEDGPGGGGAKTPSFIPQYTKELNHRTKPGGQAINQVTNLQLTFADRGWIYSAGEKVARRITISPYKNSYGPEARSCNFALKPDNYLDTDSYLDGGLRWDYTEVEWLADQGFMGFRKTGTTLAQERFSCPSLGIIQASLCEAAQVWREAPPELAEALGRELRIPGYINAYDEIVRQIKPKEDT